MEDWQRGLLRSLGKRVSPKKDHRFKSCIFRHGVLFRYGYEPERKSGDPKASRVRLGSIPRCSTIGQKSNGMTTVSKTVIRRFDSFLACQIHE